MSRPNKDRGELPVGPEGLCPACRHVRTVRSARGSTFLLCRRSKSDATLPRYPPQPRMACGGHER